MNILTSALLGSAGGAARVVFSALKSILDKRKIKWNSFLLLLCIDILGGAFLASILVFNPAVSLIAGYASFDILDTLQKSFGIKKVTIPISTKSIKKQSIWQEAFDFR